MRGIMYMIPLAYRETCRVLADHLRMVAANDEKNKMTLRNLELTWSLSVGQMTGAVMRVLAEDATCTPSTLQYRLPLDVAAENAPRGLSDKPMVPYAVTRLVEYLNENDAFSVPHLFTSEPRSIELIEDIIYVLNGGSLGVDGALPAETTPIDAAIALKQWIADIPGHAGIFPDSMRPDFVQAIPPIAASPSPTPTPQGDDSTTPIATATSSSSAHVNFSQMPDRLEPLFWKLPEMYLQTIKVLLGVLRSWTTFAPEDISSLQAIQALFTDYPLPLQHVLAYLLHNYDQLFAGEDMALTAHLQALVFASPSNANGNGVTVQPTITGLGSPLSPRHLAFNNKVTQPQQTTPTSASSNTSNTSASSPTSGGESSHATADANGHELHSADEGDEQQHALEGASAVVAAAVVATASGPATPGSPSGKIKKVKSTKSSGSSPSGSSGKTKRVREAEDGDLSTTPTRKTRTGLSKNKSTSDSPSSKLDSPSKRSASPSKGKTSDDGTPNRTRHLKSSSADVDSPTGKRTELARSGSKKGTKESSTELSSSPPRKPLSRSPSTDESSDDSVSNGTNGENGSANGTSKRSQRTRLSREVTDDPELALKKTNEGGTHEKVRRSKSSSSAGSATVSPSPSAEDVSVKKRAPKKREDSDGGASNDTSASNTPEPTPEKSDTNGSAKKKKKKDAEMETVAEETEAHEPAAAEPEGASTPKSRKKKSDDTNESPSGSTEKRKKSEKRSKSNDPTSAAVDSTDAAEATNGAPESVSSPKKSRKATPADDITAIPSSKKASRIKVSTPLADA